jgi:multiple antibiotic resistance protein
MTIISAVILLFLVIDPIGNIPCYLSVLKGVDPARRRAVVIRELLIALVILIMFMFTGKYILKLLQISQSSLGIAGGIVLFLIAIKMIFSGSTEIFANSTDGEPLVVPLAVPFVAGPSAITTVILMMAKDSSLWGEWLVSLVIAWFLSGLILLFSEKIGQLLGNRVLIATERLMGMLLTVVSVEMLVTGIRQSFKV